MTQPTHASEESAHTSTSLLNGMRANERDAWLRFQALYGEVVHSWCRRFVQEADAADVCQEVFVAVARNIAKFERRRETASFRRWLWRITRNKVHDYGRRQVTNPRAIGGTDFQMLVGQIPDEPPEQSESGPDSDCAIVKRALEMIRSDYSEKTWNAFLRMADQRETSAEIAADLDMSDKAVRMAKFRILKKLREVLAGLLELNEEAQTGNVLPSDPQHPNP